MGTPGPSDAAVWDPSDAGGVTPGWPYPQFHYEFDPDMPKMLSNIDDPSRMIDGKARRAPNDGEAAMTIPCSSYLHRFAATAMVCALASAIPVGPGYATHGGSSSSSSSPTSVPDRARIGLGQQPLGNAGQHLGALWGVSIPFNREGLFPIPKKNDPPGPPAGADNEGAPGVADWLGKGADRDSKKDSKKDDGKIDLGPLGGLLYFLGVPPEAALGTDPSRGGGMTQIDPPQLDLVVANNPVESIIPDLDPFIALLAGAGFSGADIELALQNRRDKQVPKNAEKAATDPKFRKYLEELAAEGNIEARLSLDHLKKSEAEKKSAAETQRTIDSAVEKALKDPEYRENIMKVGSQEIRDAIIKAESDKAKKKK